jgi:Protein of unknown function (DUF3551)
MSILSSRNALKAAFVLGALLVVGSIDAGSSARAEGAWCAQAGGRSEYRNCGYYTFNQCLAAISGVGTFCAPNPYYVASYRTAHQR